MLDPPLLAIVPLELDEVLAEPSDEEAEPVEDAEDVEAVDDVDEIEEVPELDEGRLELPPELPALVSRLLVELAEKLARLAKDDAEDDDVGLREYGHPPRATIAPASAIPLAVCEKVMG